MKVILFPKAYDDLLWFRSYYRQRFPEGAVRGAERYKEAIERLREMPFIGRPVPDRPVREYMISRTPFLLIYRVVDDRVEVLRVWDARAEHVGNWLGDED